MTDTNSFSRSGSKDALDFSREENDNVMKEKIWKTNLTMQCRIAWQRVGKEATDQGSHCGTQACFTNCTKQIISWCGFHFNYCSELHHTESILVPISSFPNIFFWPQGDCWWNTIP